ncbi:hypothetical protein Dip518_001342 [Parelusimicrobium proximum]|uniref:hypothetical protein n=1 Tax=Parelusimicrobium proximum TaxID=3228953 RepID=UPI003D176B4D
MDQNKIPQMPDLPDQPETEEIVFQRPQPSPVRTPKDNKPEPAPKPLAGGAPVHEEQGLSNMTIAIIALVFLALVAVYPVTILIKRANNIAAGSDIAGGIQVDIPIQEERRLNYSDPITSDARKGFNYSNAGSDLLIPTRLNLKTFSQKDMELLGRAPWALLNTVFTNYDDPEVIKSVFNSSIVTNAYVSRKGVAEVLADPNKLYAIAKNEAALAQFFSYEAVQAALSNPKTIEAISSSRLMDAVLRSAAVQYFIKNPRSTAQTINASPTLSALKKNAGIAQALRTNRHTSSIAATLLR